ncbi:MAG TPA: ABC transporter substrate-binding protein [Acidimicrobiales bacterium]|nr:ABC transporter substrate-binding protein [Acidimicrobiales bacterium]
MRGTPHRLRGASVIVLCLVVAACGGGGGDDETAHTGTVTVASFAFTESEIVAELYAQALSAVGVPTRRAPGLGSREVVEPALEQGAVDIVPEYVGTALQFLVAGGAGDLSDTAVAHARLREAFEPRGVTVLEPAEAQDRNGVAVTIKTATRLGLSRISDLAPVAGTLVFGGPPECPERPFCLVGLRATYGLAFKEFRALDASGPKTVAALEGEEIDVGLLFTTSPALSAKELVLLEDDRRLQPAENLVPAVRTDTLRRHGERLRAALDAVSAQLRTDDLIALNRSVEMDGATPARAAREWLAARGLGPA